MRSKIILIFLLSSSVVRGVEWSDSNVMKFNSANLSNYDDLQDYENISNSEGYISSLPGTNGWLLTGDISVSDNYIFSSAFINMSVTAATNDNDPLTNSYVILQIFDNEDGVITGKQIFYKTGSMELNNIFLKNASLYLEIRGNDTKVYSFGICRKELSLIKTNDLIITPEILFNGENPLLIKFSINYPALVDILIFDKKGTIIDAVCRQHYFTEGSATLSWDPESISTPSLTSGDYFVYFKAVPLSGKSAEVVKKIIFVKN